MKKNRLIGLALATLTGAFFIQGCDLVKDIEYKVNPCPVEMHGDTVTLNINGKFIEKGIHKKAIVEMTPVIVMSDGTEVPFKTETFQGEKAAGNGKVIPKTGGSFSYSAQVPYKPNMEVSEVKVKILPKKGSKEKEMITTDAICVGTIITPYLMMSDDKVIFGKDKFVRTTSHTAEAIINYQKGRHEVQAKELRDKDYTDFMSWVSTAMNNPRIDIKGITIPAYASPEGEIELNSNLANDRARTASEAVARDFKKMKFEKGADAKSGFYNLQGKGEDWEGFKRLMEASDIPDKALIIRVLEMYSDLKKREEEIRNMAKTYKVVEDKILPQLRRSVITLSYDLNGKTDQELTEWSKSKADSMTVEELMKAGDLATDMNEKLRVYREVSRVYPKDWRGPNNVGAVLFMQGKINEANAEFDKAISLAAGTEGEKIVKNNLAACARQKGDRDKAANLLAEASGAGPEVEYNMGLISIQRGKYSDAVSQLSSGLGNSNPSKSFNLALAQLLNGDGGSATSTLDGSAEKDAALSYYLRAIIAARSNNGAETANNLKQAIAKDPSLKAKAAKDREFWNLKDNADVKAVIG